jgi:proline dehydrogenase
MARGDKIEVVIASHNQQSIELALKEMQKFNLPPSAKVYFGQLLGMADHLTFHLGKAGYKAYKYVPYGKVNEVMPYLIRRAQENADVLGNAKAELKMIMAEIKRRVNPFK